MRTYLPRASLIVLPGALTLQGVSTLQCSEADLPIRGARLLYANVSPPGRFDSFFVKPIKLYLFPSNSWRCKEGLWRDWVRGPTKFLRYALTLTHRFGCAGRHGTNCSMQMQIQHRTNRRRRMRLSRSHCDCFNPTTDRNTAGCLGGFGSTASIPSNVAGARSCRALNSALLSNPTMVFYPTRYPTNVDGRDALL